MDSNTHQTYTNSTTQTDYRSSNLFRKNLLCTLRNKYHISEYDYINIRLKDLKSSSDLLFYWGMDASITDLLKNPVIILLNDE